MKLHERTITVDSAKRELSEAIMSISKKHELTPTELLQMLVSEMQTELKYCLRAERHPNDSNKGADEA